MCSKRQEKLAELKTVLRALLISQGKTETSVRRLAGLYREEEGKFIQYKEYGYQNLVELLADIPDTCHLKYNQAGECCVYPVSTEKTAHVSSLVARQRPKRKSKSTCTYRGRNWYYQQQQRRVSATMHKPQPLLPPPVTSSLVLQVMNELRNSSMYARTRGLRKVDVLARVKGRAGNRASTYHIHNLNYHLSELGRNIAIKDDCIFFKDDLVRQTEPSRPFDFDSAPSMSGPAYQSTFKPIQPADPSFNGKPIFGSMTFNNKASSSVITKPPMKVPVNGTTLASSREVTSGTMTTTTMTTTTTNVVKPLLANGFANAQTRDIELGTKESHSAGDLIKDRTRIRLEKLIESRPEGIWCSDLPSIYKNEYNMDLEYSEMGFNTVIEFVAALPEIFTIVEPGDTKRQMIVSTKKQYSNGNESKTMNQKSTTAAKYYFEDAAEDVEPIPLKLSQEVSKTLIPEGYMSFNETVDQIQVASLARNLDDEERYIEVNVSEIFTPSFFWVKLRKNRKKFNELMDRLGHFYGTNKDLTALKIPQCILQPGLNVACLYSDLWHRAIVKKVKPDGFVVVFFYDYGTVKTYNPNELYFLHKSFSMLPAQAIACALHYVRPIGSDEWPKSSTNAFIKKVWDLPLVAQITSINEENNTMVISMTDTTDENEDVHINDWLVENNLAQWGKMANKIPLHRLCQYDEVELLRMRDEERITDEEGRHRRAMLIQRDKDNANAEMVGSTSVDVNVVELAKESASAKVETTIDDSPKDLNKKLSVVGTSEDVKSDVPNKNEANESTHSEQTVVNGDFTRRSSFSSVFSSVSQKVQLANQGFNEFSQTETLPNGYVGQGPPLPSTDSSKAYSICQSTNGDITNGNSSQQTITRSSDSKSELLTKNMSNDESHCTNRLFSFQTVNDSSTNSTSTSTPTYFTMNLSKRMESKKLHVFHYENEGWLWVEEFVNAFTNLRDPRVMTKLLSCLAYTLHLKCISRDMEPQFFSDLDKYSELDVPRENNKIKSDFVLELLSLKDMLTVLEKLTLVPFKATSEAVLMMKHFRDKAEQMLYKKYNNKIFYDVLNVVFQYKDYKNAMKH